MSKRILSVEVPDGMDLVAGVAVMLSGDGQYTVQEYRTQEALSRVEMARVLGELVTTLEFEANFNDED